VFLRRLYVLFFTGHGTRRKPAARSLRSIRRLRICCVVQGPSGFAVTRGCAHSGIRPP
jgi:hypothetical protein